MGDPQRANRRLTGYKWAYTSTLCRPGWLQDDLRFVFLPPLASYGRVYRRSACCWFPERVFRSNRAVCGLC